MKTVSTNMNSFPTLYCHLNNESHGAMGGIGGGVACVMFACHAATSICVCLLCCMVMYRDTP